MNTVSELIEEYARNNPSITSPYTVKLLEGTERAYSAFLGRSAYIADLTDNNLRAFIAHRQREGKAPATVEREGCKILTVWRYAAMHGLVKPPTLKLAKPQTQIPVAFLKHEIKQLFRSAKIAKGSVGGVPNSIYWPAMLGMVWDSGERVGAIRALKREDIDLKKRWVIFRKRKGNGAELMKRMSWATRRAVRKLLEAHGREHPFAPAHLTTTYFGLNKILEAAGLPTDRRSKLHRIRRSHASYLKLAGGDSQASLGHASEATTQKHYYDPRVVARKQPTDRLFNPFGWAAGFLALFGW